MINLNKGIPQLMTGSNITTTYELTVQLINIVPMFLASKCWSWGIYMKNTQLTAEEEDVNLLNLQGAIYEKHKLYLAGLGIMQSENE